MNAKPGPANDQSLLCLLNRDYKHYYFIMTKLISRIKCLGLNTEKLSNNLADRLRFPGL